MTSSCESILELLGCEYELLENMPNNFFVFSRYEELLEQGKKDGFTPLLIVVSDILLEAMEIAFEDAGLEPTPRNAKKLRREMLEQVKNFNINEYFSEEIPNELLDDFLDDDFVAQLREKQEEKLVSYMDEDMPFPEIILAKIPTKKPWEAAIWVPMGGFNSCPDPIAQAAVFEYWCKKYQAVPAVVTYNTWEFLVSKPPKRNLSSELLAKEQFTFCDDLVSQAQEEFATVRALASFLKNSPTWYFWWD